MKAVTYHIPNISCSHCVNTIEMELKMMEGVIDVKADEKSRQAVITFEDPATEEKIKELLGTINYPVQEK